MPLGPILGWTKHQVLGGRLEQTFAKLQTAAELHLHHRVAQAEEQRDLAWARDQPATAEKPVSVHGFCNYTTDY
jgi:hypothetical protein